MAQLPPPERHRPVPGLLGLPRHLLDQLSPRARRATVAGAALALLVLAGAVVVLVPRIADSKRERAERDRAELARRKEVRSRERTREQRPRPGRASAGEPSALAPALEAAIGRDARARRRDDPEVTPVRRVECELPPEGRRANGERAYVCTAVTSDLPGGELSQEGVIGYPYRALADPATGRFAFCRFEGRAGEGSLYTPDALMLPRACGG